MLPQLINVLKEGIKVLLAEAGTHETLCRELKKQFPNAGSGIR